MGIKRVRRTEDEIRIGAAIRNARIAAGITQARLARALDVSVQQVQNYETGKIRIAASTLKIAAEFLDVPIRSFFDPQVRSEGDLPKELNS